MFVAGVISTRWDKKSGRGCLQDESEHNDDGRVEVMAVWVCRPGSLQGTVNIPGSKSHSIRAVIVAALAQGESRLEAPLVSEDTRAALRVYRGLGMKCSPEASALADGAPVASPAEGGGDEENPPWILQGTGGRLSAPDEVLDAANSGTTTRLALGSCALLRNGAAVLTGDAQLRRRPAAPLLNSLNELGARVFSTRGNGLAPFVIRGPLHGGETEIEGATSQYVSSLLFCSPLADGDSQIRVPLLNEKPYVEMTLAWLRQQGIRWEGAEDLSEFHVPGGQTFKPFRGRIPADFSSATFFLCAGALSENNILCRGLDMEEVQGDKAVVAHLEALGAEVSVEEDGVRVKGRELRGAELDLNATPDALPMLAVSACFARGRTRLVNVAQARIKETDRIAVMCEELTKMGARIKELPDGLEIEESPLHGAYVHGHDDHRVVMALAVAASVCEGETIIETAEAAAVTYPGFARDFRLLGGLLEEKNET